MTENSIVDSCEQVYRLYGTMLYRICCSYLGSVHDAEDALQDVFCKYMVKLPSFKSEEHRKAWLIKATVNHCKDVLRSKKRRQFFGYDEEIKEDAATKSDEDFGVLEMIFSLPEKYKEVFVLHYLENISVMEISSICAISQSAVKMRLMRGRELLKDMLRKEGLETD